MKKNLLTTFLTSLFFSVAIVVNSQCSVSPPNISINGMTITYTATGTGATVPTYIWDFGDQSGFSISQSGNYTYSAPGTYNVCVTYIDGVTSCFDQQCTTITITNVGVDETQINAYEAYPNPANDELYIKSDQRIQTIEIIDITGKIIFKEDYNINIVRLDMTALTSGFYFTRVRINDVIYTQKIQKL